MSDGGREQIVPSCSMPSIPLGCWFLGCWRTAVGVGKRSDAMNWGLHCCDGGNFAPQLQQFDEQILCWGQCPPLEGLRPLVVSSPVWEQKCSVRMKVDAWGCTASPLWVYLLATWRNQPQESPIEKRPNVTDFLLLLSEVKESSEFLLDIC